MPRREYSIPHLHVSKKDMETNLASAQSCRVEERLKVGRQADASCSSTQKKPRFRGASHDQVN
jgi:hypothetical protein